jgi:CheY-like chemotaxis protein
VSAFADVPVLLVSWHESAREAVCRALETWGMEVDVVDDHTAGIELARQRLTTNPYRIVILDAAAGSRVIQTAIDEVSAFCVDHLPELAIVVMAFADDQSSVVDRSGPCPIAVILEKPVTRSDLLVGVSRALGSQSLAGGLRPHDEKDGSAAASAPADVSLDILVAEDTAANQQLVRKILVDRGHRVTIAADGRSAFREAGNSRFDVILMDIQMPVMDGYEATHMIRSDIRSPNRTTPIVAMTAHAMPEDRARCLEAGMNDYVAKPINRRTLVDCVEATAMNRMHAGGEAEAQARPTQTRTAPAGSPAPPASVLQFVEAMKRLGGDRALYREMATCLFEDAPALIAKVHDCLTRCDANGLSHAAHTLKSLTATVGGQHAADAAGEIERLALSDGSLAEAASRVDPFERLLEATCAAVRQALDRAADAETPPG